MNRLQEQFEDRIDFFHLSVDFVETLDVRQQYNMVRRSQYQLLDPAGETAVNWFGPLYEEQMVEQIEAKLAEFATQ